MTLELCVFWLYEWYSAYHDGSLDPCHIYIDKSVFRHPGSIAHTHREREGREPMARLMQSSLPGKQVTEKKKCNQSHTHTYHTTKTTVLRMTKMGGPGEKKKKRVQKVGSTFI